MAPNARLNAAFLLPLLAVITAADVRSQSYIVDVETGTPGIQSTTSVTLGSPIDVEIIMLSPGPGVMATGFTSYGVATEYNDVAGVLTLVPAGFGFPATFDPSGLGLSSASATDLFDMASPPPSPAISSGAPLGSLGYGPGAIGAGGAFTESDGGVGVLSFPPSAFFGGPAGMPAGGTPIPLHVITFSASAVGTSDVAPIGLFPCAGYPFCAPLAGPPAPPAALSGPGAWPSVAELYDELTGTPIAATGIPPVTPGTITVTMPLPVELVSFDAVVDKSSVKLSWETASETDNLGFDVEHLARGKAPVLVEDWTSLGFVEGRGSTSQGGRYGYEVGPLGAGRHLFRLKQIDLDGASDYSETIEVQIALPVAFELGSAYPNPFNPETTITLAVDRTQAVRVEVFDLSGRVVAVLHDGLIEANTQRRLVLRSGNLPSGLYIYRAVGEFFQASKSVAIVK